jgi:cysteinyl-tRNA synthetase
VTEDKVTEMAAKATGTWDKLEQVFENRVARALNSLGVPTKDDVAQLAKRVAELKAEVEKLNKGEAGFEAKPRAVPVRQACAQGRAQGGAQGGSLIAGFLRHKPDDLRPGTSE